MAQDPNRVVAGARAKILIENIEVGYATDVRISRPYQTQVVEALGDPDPKEIEIVGRGVVTISMSKVYLDRQDLVALGLLPGDSAAAIVDAPALTFELYDAILDRMLARATGLKPSNEDFALAARGLATENVVWQATRVFYGDAA